MLSGDNSILQKATDAKTSTEKATIIEQAKTDILGQIAENKGENISKLQLATILNKQFKSVDSNNIPDDISAKDMELTTIDEKYKINLSEIYNGKFVDNTNLDEQLADGEAKLYCDVTYNDSMTEATINVKLLIGGYEYTVQTFDEWFEKSNLYGRINEDWYVQKEIELQNLYHRQEKEDGRPLSYTDEEIENLNSVNDFSGLMAFYKEIYGLPSDYNMPENLVGYIQLKGWNEEEIPYYEFIINYFQDLECANEYTQYKNMQYELQQGSLKYTHLFSIFGVELNNNQDVHCGDVASFKSNKNGEYTFRVYNKSNDSIDINDETTAITKNIVKIEGLEESNN